MDQIKLRKLDSEQVESTTNESTTYVVIQSPMDKLPLVVTQVYFTRLVPVTVHFCSLNSPLYSNFALPWRCDIMKYSFIYQFTFDSTLKDIC